MTPNEIAYQTFCYPNRPVIDTRERLTESERRAYYYRHLKARDMAAKMGVTIDCAHRYIGGLRRKGWLVTPSRELKETGSVLLTGCSVV